MWELLADYPAIVTVAAAVITGVVIRSVTDRKKAVETARELAVSFLAEVEENARKYALAGLTDDEEGHREWVYKWYDWLPEEITRYVDHKTWCSFVDWSSEHIKEWLNEEELE